MFTTRNLRSNMAARDQTPEHLWDNSSEQTCEATDKCLASKPSEEVLYPPTGNVELSEVPDSDPASIDQLWKAVSKTLKLKQQHSMATTSSPAPVHLTKRNVDAFMNKYGITLQDSISFHDVTIGDELKSADVESVCIAPESKGFLTNHLQQIHMPDFQAFVTEKLFRQAYHQDGTYGISRRLMDYEAIAEGNPDPARPHDRALMWYAPVPLSALPSIPAAPRNSAQATTSTTTQRPPTVPTGNAAPKGNPAAGAQFLSSLDELQLWATKPHILYALTDKIFSATFKSRATFLPRLRDDTMYPYLTVDVVAHPLDAHLNAAFLVACRDPLVFGVTALYNRWLLAQQHDMHAKRVAASSPPSASTSSPSEQEGDAHPGTDSILHFVVLVSQNGWLLVKISPQSWPVQENKWAGVRVETWQRGNIRAGFDDLADTVRRIHTWGTTSYKGACKRDVEGLYKCTGGAQRFLSPDVTETETKVNEEPETETMVNEEPVGPVVGGLAGGNPWIEGLHSDGLT
ncbi:hypothetical protein BU26DRAFT_586507 [Trematosphaeria pertusa]|uniref:Uncharacterized protein n=1 Tax=Trematosphaeria pertusa TaxID=390896 RepID=A0A6A6HTQ7_9PLEO|nr:uncharacterized protein BU26DRAFT_586507 [Trematosphaeria pertusa]KAF2240913.1 hypothetical protein BU26DRAFT_586507 [Trematosphaeria pertusa]